ncbi:MAG: aldehyde dehydrogenase family protein [Erysipelothrix sp.]|jgi:aldehyde dehydrogenase (NAD+)|nr:aldehyde dehydrogenase family protein [Erysipelothrix sp.]
MYKPIFDSQKAYFKTHATLPLQARLESISKLENMITVHEKALCEAVYKDLNKSESETFLTELLPLKQEITYIRKHLKSWMKAKRKPKSLATITMSSKVLSSPKGVVLIVSPWNYPIQLALMPLISALSAGNTAIVKVSEMSSHIGALLTQLINETFDPQLVYATDVGPEEFHDLLELPYDHLFFTGSPAIGKIMMSAAAKHLTPVTLELGGKSPAIVMADANIKVAARRIVWGKGLNCGQTCIAPDYVVVHKSIKNQLVEALIEMIEKQFPSSLNNQDFPKIINERHFNRLVSYLKDQAILHGGTYDEENHKIAYTLVHEPSLDSPLMQEEIFGPILPILSYHDDASLNSILDANPNPLALYLFTEEQANKTKIMTERGFGGAAINETILHIVSPTVPFGGVGKSGMGSYHGVYSFDTFSHMKTIVDSPTWFDLIVKYPPYTVKKQKLIQILRKLV